MGRLKKIAEFYIEIIVWVAIWGIVTHLVAEYTNSFSQVAWTYIIIAIFGTVILFYMFNHGDDDDDDEEDCDQKLL